MTKKEDTKETGFKSVKHAPSSIYVDIRYYDLSDIMHPEYTQINKKTKNETEVKND